MQKRAGLVVALALLFVSGISGEIRSLTILHTNDLHARLTPLENGRGGFATLAGVIRREREHCSDCILLNAGDLAQGSPVSTIFQGRPVFDIANLFGFDASTLGNHDFDYGWMQTRSFIQTAKYPMVSANMVDAAGQLFTKPYVILRVNGLRVAVIGAMTEELRTLSTAKLLGQWHAAPVMETARKYAAEVRDQADLIVLLGHINGTEENQFLREAPEIPVIVTGHIHGGLPHEMVHDGRIVVRVKGYGEELGRLQLQVDTEKKAPVSWSWKRIPVDNRHMEPAADVAVLVKRWEAEVTKRVDQPLAVSKRIFDHSAVKRLIEQAMREETGADFAYINLGGVRDGLPKGQLLVRNIWNIMPFDNRVVFGKFKGRAMPAVVVANRKVDPDREYTLAVTDFTAANQEAEEQLRTTGLEFSGDGGLLRDVLIDWFRKKGVIE
ncbi:MAG TPA: bifunctional UDP-sugar hydrolase/5'-nucleotidase [Bryobacteraceae bacterium]|jgi:2',3'-cyclic-nucleotide 2'-phosphodiesterase/3'-nucleotidase